MRSPLFPLLISLSCLSEWAQRLGVEAVFLYSTLGASVTVPCDGLTEYHNSYISWVFNHRSETTVELSRGGMITDTDPDRAGRLRLGSNSSLHIDRLRTRDTGQYNCHQYVNGKYYTSGLTVTLFLLSITASPSENLKSGDRITLRCGLDCGGGAGSCSEAPQGLTLTWRDESGAPLKDRRDRYEIKTLANRSHLSVSLQRSDHYRLWVCALAEGGRVETCGNYTTKLSDFIREVYIRLGDFLQLPCLESVHLGPGEILQWLVNKADTINYETLYTLSEDGQITTAMEVNPERLEMTVSSSLLIRSVQAQDSGVYLCCFNEETHEVYYLNTIWVSSDHTGEVKRGSNITLTCTLTCGRIYGNISNTLVWRDSTGHSLQGGTTEQMNNKFISRLLVPELQSSERIWCSVVREGLERVEQDITIVVTDPQGSALSLVELAVRLTVFFIALFVPLVAVAVVYTKRRSSRQTEEEETNIELVSRD
ncbi:uncharacterized protein LOC136771959 [Amia ocellicauda]|uniref:uncharacterized protein LOC136771959 n=1 Tax=Amia ocellicauda TaxID=2972642 RepID=UPI0034639B2C